MVKVNVADNVAESILRNAASSLPNPTTTESLLLSVSKASIAKLISGNVKCAPTARGDEFLVAFWQDGRHISSLWGSENKICCQSFSVEVIFGHGRSQHYFGKWSETVQKRLSSTNCGNMHLIALPTVTCLNQWLPSKKILEVFGKATSFV